MDPALFTTTVGAMVDIAIAIEKYVSYAKYQTGSGSTSAFSLIANSLDEFNLGIFSKDHQTVYG